MTIKSSVIALLFCASIPSLGHAETPWRFEPLGVECVFPTHWVLEQAAEHGDLAKGGVLVRADRTPGLPAGVRFELSLEPLAIQRTAPAEALEVLLKNLKETPKLQVLGSEKSEIRDNVSEVRVTWKIAQSRHTLESVYRILDLKDRRLVASISGRVELVAGVRDELSQLWDSIRAE